MLVPTCQNPVKSLTREMSNRIFLITVAILEGRHYVWENMDSAVIVRIDTYQKTTSIKKNSTSPYYNEYFVFEFYTTLDALMSKLIRIMVIQPCTVWRRRKLLGEIVLDAATVWHQNNHQFYHKWGILTCTRSEVYTGPRGYLKLDISILTKGDIPKTPTNVMNDTIEGNLLLPEGKFEERQQATYIFDLYSCRDIVDKPTTNFDDGSIHSGRSFYVEISFAGISVKSSIKKTSKRVDFNERLSIIDLFPPLSQRIKIELFLADKFKKLLARKYVELKNISNDQNEGFLPTLGPSFLHLYSPDVLEGFAGSILMSIDTKLMENVMSEVKIGSKVEHLSPIEEDRFFQKESVVIFAGLTDLTAIDRRFSKKKLSIRMTFGSTLIQKKITAGGREIYSNTTGGSRPKKITRNFYYLDYYQQPPLLWINQEVPYYKKRIFTTNILSKIAKELETKLRCLEQLLENDPGESIADQVSDMADFVTTSVKKYLDITSSAQVTDYITKLDIERRKMCIQQMRSIYDTAILIETYRSDRRKFRTLHKILDKMRYLIEDAQDCWPWITLWLVHGRKKVARFDVSSKDIIFSQVPEEKGRFCCNQTTICFLENPSDDEKLLAKMDVTMFLCLERQKNQCLDNLLSFKDNLMEEIGSAAQFLPPSGDQLIEIRCYIFQGKIISGFDHSGLSDPFVRIMVQNRLQETRVIERSLSPIWDQTLVFKDIATKGGQFPGLLFEILDKDECGTNEFIGRTVIENVKSEVKLEWHRTYRNREVTGEVLAAFQYVQGEAAADMPLEGKLLRIPKHLKPNLVQHKMEILLWGVRNPGKIELVPLRRPKVRIFCGDFQLESDVIDNLGKNPNFPQKLKSLILSLPEERDFLPPLRLRMYDSKKFGVYVYAGVHITKISPFLTYPMRKTQRREKLARIDEDTASYESKISFLLRPNYYNEDEEEDRGKSAKSGGDGEGRRKSCLLSKCCNFLWKNRFSPSGVYEPLSQEDDDVEDVEDNDWWTKFYASIKDVKSMDYIEARNVKTLKIYDSELESQPEFQGFHDILTPFAISKGKRTGDFLLDQQNITGIFKGCVKIYKLPAEQDPEDFFVFTNGTPLERGYFTNYPENHLLRYLLRVYCIRALNLRPKDLNGKSDPYLILTLNDQVVDDKEHYVAKNVNPVFGRCFEFQASFPHHHTLKISIWDYDYSSSDDLIGETEIDLENRFYTKHLASCGIPETYEESGYCHWRAQHKPTCILRDICQKWHLDQPDYAERSIRIGAKEFRIDHFKSSGDESFDKETLALFALRHWKEMPLVGFALVPEHVESRSLFHPIKPGIEQGKLQLWIDIFPILDVPPPQKVNITSRKPLEYELRCVIWNTEEVLLDEDDFFSGERKSDIYVKGWLADNMQPQYTDVHYRSLTGEGNFNWRFVFNFHYLQTENKIVVRKKENLFSLDETEFKFPCKLTLQVWDNDTFSKDDFIGTLTLDLAKLHRPAKTVKKCTLSIIDNRSPTLNLFKIRRTRGWWPFVAGQDKNQICTGKLEAELELLTLEEAQKEPAGIARHDPQSLPYPNRPDTSFSWFKNPLKAVQALCKLHKGKLVKVLCFMVLAAFAASAIFSFPGYTVKKLLGA